MWAALPLQAQQPGDRESLGRAVNSQYDEIGPVISPDGNTLYFTRKNHPQNAFGKDNSSDAWYSTYNASSQTWSRARPMGRDFNRERFNSIESITPDGKTVLIRGAYKRGNYKGVGFSFVEKSDNGKWGMPEQLEVEGLDKMVKGMFLGANLSNNGKVLLLYFSEEEGGETEDLYVSFRKERGEWTRPKPLGTDINTKYSELSPFIASDNKTLYFASDRPGGQGSSDIYRTVRQDDTWQKWSQPENMGEAVNSAAFDAYYSVDASGEYAYISSTTNSLGLGDIFRIRLEQEQRPDPVVLLSGLVVDAATKQPLNAQVMVTRESDGEEVSSSNTGQEGTFKITLPLGENYEILAASADYAPYSQQLDLRNVTEYQELSRELLLGPAGDESVVVVDTVPPASADTPQAVVMVDTTDTRPAPTPPPRSASNPADLMGPKPTDFIGTDATRLTTLYYATDEVDPLAASERELTRLITLLNANPSLRISLQGHADEQGTEAYNQRLSEARARYARAALIAEGISPLRLTWNGHSFRIPAVEGRSAEALAANRRVEVHMMP